MYWSRRSLNYPTGTAQNLSPLGADEDRASCEPDEGDGGGVRDAEGPAAEGDGAAGGRAERAGRERLERVEGRAERAVERVGERQVLEPPESHF